MPKAASRYCEQPGCGNKVTKARFCEEHLAPRPSAAMRGYDNQWRKVRALFLQRNPMCARRCGRKATNVDHIIPGKNDVRNMQALCAECHSRKTASRDGGFGNKRA